MHKLLTYVTYFSTNLLPYLTIFSPQGNSVNVTQPCTNHCNTFFCGINVASSDISLSRAGQWAWSDDSCRGLRFIPWPHYVWLGSGSFWHRCGKPTEEVFLLARGKKNKLREKTENLLSSDMDVFICGFFCLVLDMFRSSAETWRMEFIWLTWEPCCQHSCKHIVLCLKCHLPTCVLQSTNMMHIQWNCKKF